MYNFKDIEEEAGKILKKQDIKKAVSNDKKRKKLFSFLEGPPTANAPPGLHHLEVRTFKDIINKFHYMKGENVPRKAGWDCHGLPVEVQIEKKLGLNSKKDILKFGESRFIEECRKSVFS
ncbi:MAG: class I tRNA ligase family protein, partial [Candidatus Pacearchaeota archaeon]|nr:class I tRNA ligase family protein [Candidatus Pacearchaeota archaeon]